MSSIAGPPRAPSTSPASPKGAAPVPQAGEPTSTAPGAAPEPQTARLKAAVNRDAPAPEACQPAAPVAAVAPATVLRATPFGCTEEAWRVEQEDGEHVCTVNLTIHHGGKQGKYLIALPDRPGLVAPFGGEGAFTFDVWDSKSVRSVLAGVVASKLGKLAEIVVIRRSAASAEGQPRQPAPKSPEPTIPGVSGFMTSTLSLAAKEWIDAPGSDDEAGRARMAIAWTLMLLGRLVTTWNTPGGAALVVDLLTLRLTTEIPDDGAQPPPLPGLILSISDAKELRAAIKDLESAASDQVEPLGRRELGRVLAREKIRESYTRIDQLIGDMGVSHVG